MEVKDNLLQLDKVVQDLNKRLDENIDRIDKLSVVYNKFSKQSANMPSQYVTVLNDTKKAVDEVTISSRKLEQQSIKESNARNALNKQREQSLAQLAKEQAKLDAASNMYNKVQAKMNALSNEYKNLSTRKELGISLTDKEAKRYDFLQGKIQTYDKTLKAVDATMGKYSRNVGNYASAFNPLNNSINQLTREMPAFGNSIGTGLMAISNNIPAFFDAMSGIIAQNKELQKQGQPTKSALSQLAGAFFSWGTALSVGVTLLTLYGSKIWESISGSKKKTEALEIQKKKQEELDNAEKKYIDTITESASAEITRSKLLFENARNANLPMKERLKAIDDLRKSYPEYLNNLSNQEILSGRTADTENRLNDALIKRGIALAIQDKIKEKYKALTDQILELEKAEKKSLTLKTDVQNANKKQLKDIEDNAAGVDKLAKNQKNSTKLATIFNNAAIKISKEKQATIKKEIDTLLEIYNKYSSYLTVVNDSTGATINNTGAIKDNNDAIKEEEKALLGSVAWFEKKIKLAEDELEIIKKSSKVKLSENEDYIQQQLVIDEYKKGLEALIGVKNKLAEDSEDFTISIPELDVDIFDKIVKDKEELTKWLDDFKGKFKDDFVSNSGFSKLFDLIENFDKLKTDGVATALAISEAFQEAFNTISNASQANFDAEYSRLEQQKETRLQFAGESTAAKEEIEKRYEERRKDIQRRQAEAQKKLAIFNIATNTAQAAMAAYASQIIPGDPTSLIRAKIAAVLISVLGAAQIAMVAGQQIPQFWKGTDNAPEGLAWTQEKGAEVITDRNGNVKTYGSNKGAQLTYLNKGDKVYKSHEDYINKELSKSGIQPMGQSFSSVNISNGLTAEDLNKGIADLKRTISQKENININIDKSGFRTAVNGKEYLNNRLTLKGRNV